MSQITCRFEIPEELLNEIKHAAGKTGLSVEEVLRLAIKFGLPKVRGAAQREDDFAEAAADTWEKIGPAPTILYDKL